jgi:glycosyltransferase involved in cell wall biosynthesis
MRIVHWYPNLLAGGGVANSVLALAGAQAAAGADTWIASLAHDEPIYGPLRPADGVHISTWSGGRTLRLGGLRLHALRRSSAHDLRALEPDVVHVHAEFNPDNWQAARLWECPLVLSPHGAFHPTVMRRGAHAKRLYVSVARFLLYRKVGYVHVLSPAEEAHAAAALPSVPTYCVPQGPSPAVHEALGHLEERTDARSTHVELMFVGRIDVEAKGLDVLVEAFARAVRERTRSTPAKLTLVGPDWGNGAAPLRELAKRLGVAELVEFRGRVAAADVAALLQRCDVYVQLSRNEGSPLSLNDALALGKPAIVSDRIGTISYEDVACQPHVKVVSPSVAEAAEAIGTALDDIDGLRRAARDARGVLLDFLSWERAARRHLEVYASLRAGGPGAG